MKVTPPSNSSFLTTENAPKPDHLLQTASYEILTGREIKSLFYQDRNYGGFYEYRIGTQESEMRDVMDLLDRLNSHVDDNTLPPMLEDCSRRTGYVFNGCPFRSHCPGRTRLHD